MILEGMDLSLWRPWVFCIESTLWGGPISSYDKWEHILLENGYVIATVYGLNRYYVDSNLQTHIEFKIISEIEEKYEIFLMNDVLM